MQRIWELIDNCLNQLKDQLSGARLDTLNTKLEKLAGTGVPVAIGVILITGLLLSGKAEDYGLMKPAVIAALGVVVLGYLSYRFSDGCRTAGAGETSTLSLAVYLDLIIVVCFLGFLGGLLGGLKQIKDGNMQAAGTMLSAGFASLIVAWTVANPDRLGVRFDSNAGATNDVVSMLAVFVRIILRVALPLSSAVVIIATALTLFSGVMALGADGGDLIRYTMGVTNGTQLILAGVAGPLVVYLAYAFISFPIGVYENMLSVKDVVRNTAPTGGGGRAVSTVDQNTDPGI